MLARSIRFLILAACVAGGWAFGEQAAPASRPLSLEQELRQYYEQGDSPAWKAAVDQLRREGQEGEEAAQYLRSLLARALKDQLSGAAPWRATPFWGSSGENPADRLREAVAEALGEAGPLVAALPVYEWFLREEPRSDRQAKLAKVAAQVKTPAGEQVLRGLISPAHPNSAVLREALQEAARRKLALPAGVLGPLCQHHRKEIRQAARKAAQAAGLPEEKPFDQAAAVKSPAVQALMEKLSALVLEVPPAQAPFVVVTVSWSNQKQEGNREIRGWLVKETAEDYTVATPFGRTETILKQGGQEDRAFTAKAQTIDVAQEVARVAKIHSEGDKEFGLSERGGLTGQFEGRGASLYEILLAHWLYKTGRLAAAGEILFPALESLYRDEDLLALVRERMGTRLGYDMLVAFVGDRDYQKTLRIARLMTTQFQGVPLCQYAEELARQLPRRADDFKALALPTPQQWQEMKKKMSRPQQIRFLCDRLRLLNCFQLGQPGGVSLSYPQYAEPGGLSEDAAWGGRLGKTLLINPYVELTGENWFQTKKEEASPGLHLAVADIPELTGYLKEDWFILAVSFWRDFHSARTLLNTRRIVCDLINSAAGQDLCMDRVLAEMTPAQLQQEIEKVNAWAAGNKGLSREQLLIQALEQNLRGNHGWYSAREQAGELIELKAAQAIPVIVKYLDEKGIDEFDVADILRVCRRLDPKAARAVAVARTGSDKRGIRIQAGLLLMAAGDVAAGRTVVAEAIQDGDLFNVLSSYVVQAVEELLKEGSEPSREVAARLFCDDGVAELDSQERHAIVRMVLAAGITTPYGFYERLLSNRGNRLAHTGYGQRVADVFADELIDLFGDSDPALKAIAEKAPKRSDQRLAAVDGWLKARIAAVATRPAPASRPDK
ncbi:MAG: hypothetical protein NTV86_14450 [Planctomycetota bacterium]|nr:hypothetical protein [Planctomycetota bacterium]